MYLREKEIRQLSMWLCGNNQQKNPHNIVMRITEVPGGFEPPLTVLQTGA